VTAVVAEVQGRIANVMARHDRSRMSATPRMRSDDAWKGAKRGPHTVGGTRSTTCRRVILHRALGDRAAFIPSS